MGKKYTDEFIEDLVKRIEGLENSSYNVDELKSEIEELKEEKNDLEQALTRAKLFYSSISKTVDMFDDVED